MRYLLILVLSMVTNCVAAERLRVMTYNIHHGEGVDGKLDLERIAKIITDSKADLVALQEVDKNTKRTGNRDMPAELAKVTGMQVAFFVNFPLEGGEYGNAILSRYPIKKATNHHLPKVVEGEQRGMLETLIQTPSGEITFCNVHLDHRRDEADRLASVESIAKVIRKKSGPIFIAGDFNARPDSQTYAKMKALFSDAWVELNNGDGFTIPSSNPRSRIDYIWFLPVVHVGPSQLADFSVDMAKVIQSTASDHLPLLVEFKVGRTMVCLDEYRPFDPRTNEQQFWQQRASAHQLALPGLDPRR